MYCRIFSLPNCKMNFCLFFLWDNAAVSEKIDTEFGFWISEELFIYLFVFSTREQSFKVLEEEKEIENICNIKYIIIRLYLQILIYMPMITNIYKKERKEFFFMFILTGK